MGETNWPRDGRCDDGVRVRREAMGDQFVDTALSRNAGSDGKQFQRRIAETMWVWVWGSGRHGRYGRSLLGIGMLVAVGATRELWGHLQGRIAEAVISASGHRWVPTELSVMKVIQGAPGDLNREAPRSH